MKEMVGLNRDMQTRFRKGSLGKKCQALEQMDKHKQSMQQKTKSYPAILSNIQKTNASINEKSNITQKIQEKKQ